MEYLEQENERLRDELQAALEEIQGLRQENLALKNQLKDPNVKIKAP
jgi:regulator of replication initiation timing